MPTVILYAVHRASGQNDAPSAPAIEGALRGVQTTANTLPAAANPLGLGDWVGPHARVTRQAHLSMLGPDRFTFVAWPFTFPDYAQPGSDLARQAEAVRRGRLLEQAKWQLQRLQHGEDWSEVTLQPYTPDGNGPLSWWQNGGAGGASDTRTRDAFDLGQETGGNSTVENPVGPTLQRVDNLIPPGALHDATRALEATAWVLGIGAALYLGGPLVRGLLSALAPSPSRAGSTDSQQQQQRGGR